SQSSDPARRPMNDDGFAGLESERVVDSLERGEPRGCNRAGVFEIEMLWNGGNFVGSDGDIFGIKAALRVGPTIGVDLVADSEPAHPRSHRNHHAGPIAAEREREARLLLQIPPLPSRGAPRSDPGRVYPN